MKPNNETKLAEERSERPEHISAVVERVMRELRKENGAVFADKAPDDDDSSAYSCRSDEIPNIVA
jgi:hypothetical protein